LYPNIKYFRQDARTTLYETWNLGIDLASADLIANANCDDIFTFNAFETHVKALEKNPWAEWAFSSFTYTDTPNVYFEKHNPTACLDFVSITVYDQLGKKVQIHTPGHWSVWRKSLHNKLGKFDPKFTIFGDFNFQFKAHIANVKFIRVPGVYSSFYYNPNGLSHPTNALAHPDSIRRHALEKEFAQASNELIFEKSEYFLPS
jgi:hypothetical protein